MDENKDLKKLGIATDSPIYLDVRDKLNSVGQGFCLAKWTQVTMHLQLGHTHSCHHPRTHMIPTKEIARNPLHFTILNIKREEEKKC